MCEPEVGDQLKSKSSIVAVPLVCASTSSVATPAKATPAVAAPVLRRNLLRVSGLFQREGAGPELAGWE